jgi:uncharacterized membrane protein YeaQ/YmgE (transglycosylase-associated protein family)
VIPTEDESIHLDADRFMAERAGAQTIELPRPHTVMVSAPAPIAAHIRKRHSGVSSARPIGGGSSPRRFRTRSCIAPACDRGQRVQLRVAIDWLAIRLSDSLIAPTVEETGAHAHASHERRYQMGIIAWIVLGLLAGAVAKAILPGDDPGGMIVTMVIGIVGAIIGGLIGEWVGFGGLGSFFDLRTWVLAVAGSVLLLLLVRLAARGGGHRRRPVSH